MDFTSIAFLFVFLPVSLLIYSIVGVKYKKYVMLFFSLGFYIWGGIDFVGIICVSIFINYLVGLIIDNLREKNIIVRRIVLVLGILANVGVLLYFKYTNFLIGIANYTRLVEIPLKDIVLPIGISFYTFKCLSYVIDVYMKKIDAEKSLINVAVYVMLFPELMAGPISRFGDINKQFNNKFDINKFIEGIKRLCMGLAKKVIISNQLAEVADGVFGVSPHNIQTVSLWLGIICYMLQIYFDFSGYSDMAIGIGRMFSIEFVENFDYPYLSKSITEFWRRWHITLGSWFRDYIYIPLGGSRKGNVYLNLLMVFIVTGIWHGANWTFILWGLWHGIFIVVERALKQKCLTDKIPSFLKWVYTIFVVLIGWVLFRSNCVGDAMLYLQGMFGIIKETDVCYTISYFLSYRVVLIIIIAIIGCAPWREIEKRLIKKINVDILEYAKRAYCLLLFAISIIYVMTSSYSSFIYFKF